MKMKKRITALMLSVLLIVGMFPFHSSATELQGLMPMQSAGEEIKTEETTEAQTGETQTGEIRSEEAQMSAALELTTENAQTEPAPETETAGKQSFAPADVSAPRAPSAEENNASEESAAQEAPVAIMGQAMLLAQAPLGAPVNGDVTLINLIDINAITSSLFEVKPQGSDNFIELPLPDGTILHVGDEVHIKFDYKTLNDVVPGNVYFFDIPKGLSAITGDSRGEIKDGDTVIGEYWVDDGKVKLQFTNEEYLDETGNEITTGFVNFYARLNQDAVDEQGVIRLGDTIIGTVPIVPDVDITNVSVTKWNGDGTAAGGDLVYDPVRNAVQYTFEVNTNGNNKNIDTITVKDVLTTTVNNQADPSIVTGTYQDVTVTPSGAGTFAPGTDGNYVLTANNVAPNTTIKVTYWVPVKNGIVQAKFVNDVDASKTVGGTTTAADSDSVQGSISNNMEINKRAAAPVFDPASATTTVTYTVTVTAPNTNTAPIPDAYVEDKFTINGEFVKSVEKLSGDVTFGPLTTGNNANFTVQLGTMAPGSSKTYTYKATLDTNKCYFYNAPDYKWFDNWATAKTGDIEFDKSKASLKFEKQFTDKNGTYDPTTGKYRFILTFDGTIPGTNNQYYDKVLKSFADEITTGNATFSGTPAPKLEAMQGNTVVLTRDLDGTQIDGQTSFDLDIPTDMQGKYSYRLTYYMNLPEGTAAADTVKNKFTAAVGIGPGGQVINFESNASVSAGSAASNAMSKWVDIEGGTNALPGNNEFGITKFGINIYSPIVAGATLTDWSEKTSGAMVDLKMPLEFTKQNMTIKYAGRDLVEGDDYKIEAVGSDDDRFMITFLKAIPGVTDKNAVSITYLAQNVASEDGKTMAENPTGGKIGNQKEVYNYAQLVNGGLTTDKKAKVDFGGYLEKKVVNKEGMDAAADLIGWDIVITNGYFDAFGTGFHPLVDTIPANQEVVKVEQFMDNREPQACSTDPAAEHGYSTVTNADGTSTVTINAYTGCRNHPQTYRVWTRIKDSYLIENQIDPDNFDDLKVTNSAYFEAIGTKWNVSAETAVSRKNNEKKYNYNAATEAAGGVEFVMTINAEGLNMDALGDTITVCDTMNRALTLKKETLRINGQPVEQVQGAKLTYNEGSNEFTLELPDETPFTITYIAEIDAEKGEAGWLSNEAYVEGRYGTFSTSSEQTERLDVSAGSSSTLTFYLKKADKDGKLLSGGQFQFRKVELQNGQLTETPVVTASSADGTFFDFKDGTYKFRGVNKGVIYALEEMNAPEGCKRDEEIRYIYFGTAPADVKAALEADGKTLIMGHTGGASKLDIMFQLENDDAVTDIKVEKKWEDGNDAAGLRPDSVTVVLKADGVEKETKNITKDAQGKWEVTFTDLPTHKTNDDATRSAITYTLEEIDVAGYTKAVTGDAANGFTVTNTRTAPSPASVTFSGTKLLTENGQAKAITAGQFSFTMEAAEGNPEGGAQLPANTTAQVAADGSFSFDAVSFSRVGIYRFNFKETAGSVNGYTYDPATVTATVLVSMNAADNTLVVGTPVYAKGDAAATGIIFENTYAPSEGSVTIPVKKLLTGEARTADTSFHFTLSAKNNAPMPQTAEIDITVAAAKDSVGTGSFGPITFTGAGTYGYTITERNDAQTGFTYDLAKDVTVTVTDNGGNLTAEWALDGAADQPDAVTFTNAYAPTPVSISIPVLKNITGAARTADTTFHFTLTGADQAPMPAVTEKEITVAKEAGSAGNTSFGTITFTKAGTYVYTITERDDGQTGFGYDGPHTVTVNVTDQGGSLAASWTVDGGNTANADAVFTNTYAPGAATVTIPVLKNLTGQERPGETTFHFTLSGTAQTTDPGDGGEGEPDINMLALGDDAAAEAPMPDETELDITVPAAAGSTGTGTFGPISFTQAGTYEYTITERNDNQTGFTYDTAHKVTVVVTDNAGTLSAVWTVDQGTDQNADAVFTNNYQPTAVSAAIPVVKNITGAARSAQASFHFTLTGADGAPMPAETEKDITVAKEAGSTGTASFGAITFTKAGTYVYTIAERDDGLAGFGYDGTHTVTVEVTDNAGTLEAKWTVDQGNDENADVVFTNTYAPGAATVTIPVVKKITGNERPDAASFHFTMTGSNNAPMPAEAEKDITVGKETGSTGSASFGPISFTAAGNYEYTITERNDAKGGFTYDTTHTAFVEVTDNAGTLEAKWTVDQGTEENAQVVFTNDYTPAPTEIRIPVIKNITGNERPEETSFHFTLSDGAAQGQGTQTDPEELEICNLTGDENAEPAPMPAETEIDITVGAAAGSTGNGEFGPISFTKAGTYEYTITETNDGQTGFTYDTAHTVSVTVTDTNGVLSAVWTVDGGEEQNADAVFTNSYAPEAAKLTIPVEKLVAGNVRPEGNEKVFTFELSENGQTIDTKTIQGEGRTAFDELTYTSAGTYTYTVSELAGQDHGYTYSTEIQNVVVTVEDLNGQLQVSWTINGDAAGADSVVSFTNNYKPDEVGITIPVTKTITGNARPEDSIFHFTLTGSDDAPMPAETETDITVAKEAESVGAGSFGEIVFTAAGTYEYEITERNDGAHGFGYDTMHSVTVEVVDVEGVLGAVWTVDGGEEQNTDAAFTNTYSPDAAELELPVSKSITGNERPEDNKKDFTFELSSVNGAPMPETNTVTVTDAAQAAFEKITYTEAGIYEYIITEKQDSYKGYTFDQHAAHVRVTVTDTDGVLSATWILTDEQGNPEGEEGAVIEFINDYKPAGTSVILPLKKTITGDARQAADQKEFTFELSRDGEVIDSKIIKDQGESTFAALTFEEAGTYTYTVREVKGTAEGYTYDDTVYEIVVTVIDEDGTLTAAWTANGKSGKQPEFVNRFEAKKVVTPLTPVSTKPGKGTPFTGDNRNMMLWFVLLFVSGCGAVGTGVMRRKKDSNR